jgi:hypothetical protein
MDTYGRHSNALNFMRWKKNPATEVAGSITRLNKLRDERTSIRKSAKTSAPTDDCRSGTAKQRPDSTQSLLLMHQGQLVPQGQPAFQRQA